MSAKLLTLLLFAGLCAARAEPERMIVAPIQFNGTGMERIQQYLDAGWTVKHLSSSDSVVTVILSPPILTAEVIAAHAEEAAKKQAAAIEAARLRHEQWLKEHPVEKTKP